MLVRKVGRVKIAVGGWARSGEAHHADAAARHQGRSKRGGENGRVYPGIYPYLPGG